MKIIALFLLITLSLTSANSLPSERRKNGPLIQQALAPVQVSLQESSAVFYNNEDSRHFLYGTVVSEDGLILTKYSELAEVEDFHVRVGSKKYRSPQVISRNEIWDLALVKIEASNLQPVNMSSHIELVRGTWLVSNGANERRFRRVSLGIVSANKREIPGGSPAVLGVALNEEDKALLVGKVNKESGAYKAGLREGDLLLELNGSKISNRESFIEGLTEMLSGDMVKLKLEREEEVMEIDVELMPRHIVYPEEVTRNVQLSGGPKELSARRSGFPMVFQHETRLSRRSVGGPVFTLDGDFVGMNIAHVDRVAAFAIPSEELAEVLDKLKKK